MRETDLNRGKYSEGVRAPNEGFVLWSWREGKMDLLLFFIFN